MVLELFPCFLGQMETLKKKEVLPHRDPGIHCTEKCGDPRGILVLPRFSGQSSRRDWKRKLRHDQDVPGWKLHSSAFPRAPNPHKPPGRRLGQSSGTSQQNHPDPTIPHLPAPSPSPKPRQFRVFCHIIFLVLVTHPQMIPA